MKDDEQNFKYVRIEKESRLFSFTLEKRRELENAFIELNRISAMHIKERKLQDERRKKEEKRRLVEKVQEQMKEADMQNSEYVLVVLIYI